MQKVWAQAPVLSGLQWAPSFQTGCSQYLDGPLGEDWRDRTYSFVFIEEPPRAGQEEAVCMEA